MSNESPRLPGPSRALYQAGRRPRFGARRRRNESFTTPGRHGSAGPSRTLYRARGGRRWPKRVLVGLVSLVVLTALSLVAGYFYVDSTLGGITRMNVAGLTPEKPGQPIDILLIGSDSRAGETSAQERAAFGSPESVAGQRSDVITVVRLDAADGRVEMLSIPRDLWVPIAGTGGDNRINSAFNSGPSQLVETIEQDLGIPINHVVVIGFAGFSGMVDSLGGIYLDFPMPVRDAYSGLDVTTTGCQLVDGTQALALVRSRHLYYFDHGSWQYDGMSDWSRIRRQQAFFHALLDRLHGVVPNLFRLNSFLDSTVTDVAVDSDFKSSEMISIGYKYHSLSSGNLVSSVLPTSPTVIDGQDVLLAPQPQTEQAVAQFLGTAGTASDASRAGHGSRAGPALAAAQSASAGIVYDTPQALPEPWNPTPC